MQRLRNKLRYLRRYTDLRHSLADVPALLRIALLRFRVFKSPDDCLIVWSRRIFGDPAPRLKLLRGLKVTYSLSDVSHLWIFDDIYLNRMYYDLARIPFAPKFIIDCGAHAGFFSLLAMGNFPGAQLLAFEPNPENARWARAQVRQNFLNGLVIEAAVSTTAGESSFVGTGQGGQLAAEAGPLRVRVVDLPGILRACRFDDLLIKIDIEGEEMKVLPALLPFLPRKCFIYYETHGDAQAFEQLRAGLEGAGFAVWEEYRVPTEDPNVSYVTCAACRHPAD